MPAKGAHGEAGGTHDSEHSAALVTVLDGFTASMEAASKPFGKLLALTDMNDWATKTAGTDLPGFMEDMAAITAPPAIGLLMVADAEAKLNAEGGGLPPIPIAIPAMEIELTVGDPDLVEPFAAMDLAIAGKLSAQMATLAVGTVFQLPFDLLLNSAKGSPPTPPDFGILDAIKGLFPGDPDTPDMGISAATYMASCLADRFVPLKAYEGEGEGEGEAGGEEAASEGEGEGEGTP